MFKKTLVCLLIALMFVGVWFEALEVTIAAQTQPKITLIKSLDELGEVPKIQRESPEKPHYETESFFPWKPPHHRIPHCPHRTGWTDRPGW